MAKYSDNLKKSLCIRESFFCRTAIFVVSLMRSSVKESFIYRKMNAAPHLLQDMKAFYLGLLGIMVTLFHSRFFLNAIVGGVFDLSILFYVLLGISVLFLITPLKLGQIFKGSLIINLFKD
ncbi:MAG: hypothetical protein A2Z72_02880 [Omnitrophica bacterium RBG_13_46_9]|nr:MAG: hypothetical protein A2Z72_02880 [Omnitrophica bacterium RBG_13_46_9]